MKPTDTGRVNHWLEIARWAASGANAQPWCVDFEESGSSVAIRLSIDPEYRPHQAMLDVRGGAAVIALGALATNLVSLAAADGFGLVRRTISAGESEVSKPDFWKTHVQLEFEKGAAIGNPVFSPETIRARCTDRTAFRATPIPQELEQFVVSAPARHPGLRYHEFRAGGQRRLIPGLVRIDTIRWASWPYFRSFLEEIGFTSPEQHPDRIPVSQLGISRVDQLLLKTLSRWPWLHFLLRAGGAVISAKKGLSHFGSRCERIGFLSVGKFDFEGFFEIGSCFQEIWLEANRQGVAFQPLGSLLLALGYWEKEHPEAFTRSQARVIEEVTAEFREKFGLDLRAPLLGFRLGYPTLGTERSPRKPLLGRWRAGLLTRKAAT